MMRTVYSVVPQIPNESIAARFQNRVLKGHITLVDPPAEFKDEGFSTSVVARCQNAMNEKTLQIVFLHFDQAPFDVEGLIFDFFEGILVGRFKFTGSTCDDLEGFSKALPTL